MPPPSPHPHAAHPPGSEASVATVVVTFDRPRLLARCLAAVRAQDGAAAAIIVVDDASPGPDTAAAIAACPGARHLRHLANLGGAAAYCTGIEAALESGADLVWLMDDDGCPADAGCLARLRRRATDGAEIAAPLVLDEEDPRRLAFPLDHAGRRRVLAEELAGVEALHGFAHLFNGALVRAGLFRRIGLPDPRFLCRGDEVEFLLRARRADAAITLDPAARFLHPGSAPERQPILGGRTYAVVPLSEAKRRCQFRNRGYIFLRYGMLGHLAGDVIRYACHYLLRRHPDPRGFARWLAASAEGWRGRFMRQPPPDRSWEEVRQPANDATPQPQAAPGWAA